MPSQELTARLIDGLKATDLEQKFTDNKLTKGEGKLILRVRPLKSGGHKEWYYRYRLGGSDRLVLIGRYARLTDNELAQFNLQSARDAAQEFARLVKQGIDPKEHAAEERHKRELAEAERQRLELENQRRAELEARKGTFGQLIDAYAGHLKTEGKASAYDVANLFANHVHKPFPALTTRKAADIEPADIQLILARMVGLGIGRRINMARACLRAAFSWAGKNDHDPRRLATDGVLFALKGNPVDLIPVLTGDKHDRVGERTLTDAELRHLWHAVADRYPSQRNIVRLALLLGGQRPKQLLAATWAHHDKPNSALILRDGKGRGPVRDHLVPLSLWATDILMELKYLPGETNHIFKSQSGHGAVRLDNASTLVADIGREYASLHGVEPYTFRDLRRTVETRLAALRVNKETRAQLLSHGRASGVQNKHYDRWHYLDEKRETLAVWEAHLRAVLLGNTTATSQPHAM